MYQGQLFDDMELRIFRSSAKDDYTAELYLPDGGLYQRDLSAAILDTLAEIEDPRHYGAKLFHWLFEGRMRAAFDLARGVTSTRKQFFKEERQTRLRLWLDPGCDQLHAVRWEALHDPMNDRPLSLSTAFSRFVRVSAIRGWTVSERPIRMLLIISNPVDQPEVDERLQKALVSQATRPLEQLLVLHRLREVATLGRIGEAMAKGYHILHLLADAVRDEEGLHVLLPDQEGQTQQVAGAELAQALITTPERAPYLIFLAPASQEGEQSSGQALTGLASLLIEAGAQAVVAIQKAMDREMLLAFMERFYEVLVRTGVVDMAVAEARGRIYEYEPDGWSWAHPVLTMRAKDAQLFQPLPEPLEDMLQQDLW
jgi:hypothetical protein